ncbi:NACHT domain-containing protein [Streptomyces sp. NBC_00365]|uniref:NACHT domain-containing protein n=1 Tax=Streptomyces sp. NBC_00365 TaxID=2975726 RepID=UPI0022589051|nr:NACHT domain-containing protein [Streptomyces sp. NBC_00365]MCX5096375.1 NACHT domain-containing protein [Streptomyces sp. NBC_00365]
MLAQQLGLDTAAAAVAALLSLPSAYLAWAAYRQDRLEAGADDLDTAAEHLARQMSRSIRVQVSEVRPLLDLEWTAEGGEMSGTADRIGSLYTSLVPSKLVVLGEAGSGKTTLLRHLVVELLETRSGNDPVPVVLQPMSWDPTAERIDAWIAGRLTAAFDLPPHVAERLVANGRVLPVIDGLDEVPPHLRSAALGQLNQGIRPGGPLVISCRTAVYRGLAAQSGTLSDAAVITLRPTPVESVITYLQTGSQDRTRWATVGEALRQEPSSPLASVLSSPLMLSLARDAYAHRDPAELLDRSRFPERVALERHLLNAYLTALAEGQGRTPVSDVGPVWHRWLAFLATVMSDNVESRFLPWLLAEKRGPRHVFGSLRVMLLSGAATVLLVIAPSPLFVIGLPACLGVGVLVTGTSRFQPPRRLTGRSPVSLILRGLIGAVLGGVVPAVAWLYHRTTLPELMGSPWLPAVVLACIGGAAGVGVGTATGQPTMHSIASVLRDDRRVAVLRASVTALATAAALEYWMSAASGPKFLVALLAGGAFLAVFTAVLMDGSAWGQYRITCAWLAARGQLPWRLQRFLAEAEHAGLLVRAQGSYEFRHPSLQDYLAAPSPQTDSDADGARNLRPFINEVVQYVLALPESAAHVAYTPAPDSGVRLAHMASEVLHEDLSAISRAGSSAYQRFQQARSRMSEVVPRPPWSWPAPFYRATTWLAAVAALSALGLTVLSPWWLSCAALALLLGGVVKALVGRVSSRDPNPAQSTAAPSVSPVRRARGVRRIILVVSDSGAGRLMAQLGVLLLISIPLVSRLTGRDHLNGIALSASLLWTVTLLAWVNSRPYAHNLTASRSDNPLDWPDLGYRLARYRDAAVQARSDWLTAVARDGVMPRLRHRLPVVQDRYTQRLPNIDLSRLTGVRRSDQVIESEAAREVSLRHQRQDSASIGISGPRGAGKSTLLQRFCGPDSARTSEDLLLLVPAPTSYDPRDFLVHLFAELCRKITGVKSPGEPSARSGRARLERVFAALAVVLGLLTMAGATVWPSLGPVVQAWYGEPRLLVLSAGGLLVLAGTAWTLTIGQRISRPRVRMSGAETAAAHHMRTLHYQLTVQRTRNAQVTLPGGLQLVGGGQVQHTENLRTYPELVSEFRGLLDIVALERRALGGRVVIGIDELDKVGTAEDAERFMNDLKAVFGVPGCHFLVALSEDALAAFGRRALDVRTALDSTFDEVITVPPLDLDQSRRLLELRGVWLPEPFLWLCHVMSGGLPRDLLRCVTGLGAAESRLQANRLPSLSRVLISQDAQSILAAQTRHAGASAGDLPQDAVVWIAATTQVPLTADAWEELVRTAPSALAADHSAVRTITQIRAYLYHGATLMRTFVEDSSGVALEWLRTAGPDPVNRLAAARAKLATDPDSVWPAVERYRADASGMTPL